jgi:hypothetical protein
MREIKFRAWDEAQKKMRYQDVEGFSIRLRGNGLDGCEIYKEYSGWVDNIFIPCQGSLMQYTGLKDKNGVKDHHEFLKEVVWSCYEWRLKDHNVSYPIVSYEVIHGVADLEIIGNIYENPELLS